SLSDQTLFDTDPFLFPHLLSFISSPLSIWLHNHILFLPLVFFQFVAKQLSKKNQTTNKQQLTQKNSLKQILIHSQLFLHVSFLLDGFF
ncbi:MAG: hypothetical protein Q8P67_04755, partial [archaeon]|nr:hypothetical protein [archaeon]